MVGCGVVFKLTQNGDGAWAGSVIHGFSESTDGGGNPGDAPVMDKHGNLYGNYARLWRFSHGYGVGAFACIKGVGRNACLMKE